jgi:hypothetical protein
MKLFEISLEAEVCFEVRAKSEDEARTIVEKCRDEMIEATEFVGPDRVICPRMYAKENGVLEISEIKEDSSTKGEDDAS